MVHSVRLRSAVAHLLMLAALQRAPLAQQGPPEQPDRAITAEERNEVIVGAAAHVEKAYVFPEVAKRMAESVTAKRASGGYDGITSAKALADTLTGDLQAVSKDKHLRVRYRHKPIPEGDPDAAPTPEQLAARRDEARWENYCFERVERLRGNVGYVKFDCFMEPADGAGEVATAAMQYLAGADALIIDLRQNGGGSPEMIQLVSSYLLDGRTHLNSFYWREGDRTEEFWTLPHVPGLRFGAKKPVYVLTSQRTFSAAEEFTYNLKNLKRATIVGETTGGGAHPGGMHRLSAHFAMFVPGGRAINPITRTNWEGTGVAPDLKVPAADALRAAHLDALKRLLPDATDADRREAIERAIAELQKPPSSN